VKPFVLALALLGSTPAWGAIAFVPASHTICSQTSASAGTACTLAGPTTAGNLVVAGLTWEATGDSINYVVGSAPGSYFFPYAQVCNGTGSCSAILICRDCSALTAVTPTFTGQTNYNLSVEEYSGVSAVGVTQAATGTSTTPGVTVTTGDANDWLVAVTSSPGSAGVPTAGTGNLRDAAGTGSTAGAACDNTVAVAGSLSCTATITSGAWSAVGMELRTEIPTTYIWPDCDSTHPCVIHEKNTVALGTDTDTLTGPFKITVPPTLPGNLMKLTISHPSSATISSITDDHSNAWTAGATTTDSTNRETTEVRYLCGAATGTSVITVAFSEAIVNGDVTQFSYDEVSGIAAASCGDGNSGSSGGQGVLNPGPIATTSNGDMILTFGICASDLTENGNQAGVAMPDDTSAKIAENDFDQFMSMVEVQGSAGAINPTIYANAQDVNNTDRMYWNIVSQAFKASSGAGTQPGGIQVVTDQHFINWSKLGWNPLPSNGNVVVFSTSNPSVEFPMTNLTDNYGTTYTRTPYSDATVDPQQYSACLGANVEARDRIFSYAPGADQTHVEIYTIAGAKNATGTGCVGTTVNHYAGSQGPILNDNIVGDPVVKPTINSGYNSAIITTGYTGTGPPTAMCISGGVTPPVCTGQSAGVIFNSIYATGMTDSSSWSTGDPYSFFYTNSTSSRSMDYLMANGTSGTAYYGAGIEIFGGSSGSAPGTLTPTVTVTPSATTITTAQSLSVTVVVSGGSGNPTPTGSVTLTGGGYTSAATTLSGGTATITIPAGSLATGSDTLTVTYTPDSSSSTTYNSATGSAPVAVTSPALTTPTVTVTPSLTSITTLQGLSVTVVVSGGSGNPTPTGSVTLTGGGYTSTATTLSGGGATINILAGLLALGSDTLTVTYTPDSSSSTTYNSATGSAPVVVTTTAPGTLTPTVTVTPSATSITTTQGLSVTVVVSGGSGNPTPTGTVTLTGGGYTSAATTLSGGGVTINIPAGSLATGSDTLTVIYTPDTSSSTIYNSATGAAPVAVTTPALITPTVTVTPSATSITTTQGLSVTLVVSGGSGNPTPTGSVALTGGGYTSAATTLSGGGATINIPAGSLAIGSDTLTVIYTPDSSSSTIYNSSTGSALVSVTQASNPGFALSNSGGITVAPGATTGNTATITITPLGGFTGTVSLSCAVATALTNPTAPPTCTMAPISVNITGVSAATATLTVSTTAATTGALSPLLRRFFIPGSGMVLAAVCFAGLPGRRCSWRRVLLLLLIVSVGFGAVGCGTTIPSTSSSTSGSGGGGGTGTGSAGTTAGVYTVTVTGTSGGVVESTSVSVTVN
jgi:hypothetical protein